MKIGALVMLLTLSSSASAQLAPGLSGSSTASYFGGQAAWDELAAFGRCYASIERVDALTLVATRPGSVEELKTYKKLFRKPYQSCLGTVSEMNASPFLVRGAIAEGLYHKRIPVPASLAVTTSAPRGQISNVAEAAICYAAHHHAEVQSLVEGTRPGSKGESQAVMALMANLSECIPPGATKSLNIGATLLRFRLAEALWRLGISPDQAVSSEAHQ